MNAELFIPFDGAEWPISTPPPQNQFCPLEVYGAARKVEGSDVHCENRSEIAATGFSRRGSRN